MRVVVTGQHGQVARALVRQAPAGVQVVTLGRPDLDLADAGSIVPAILAARPDVVISAAAYTAVDRAESEPDLAHAINAIGAGEVARGAAMAGAALLHLSSDYVFDGRQAAPYRESDPTAPLGAYGRSKLAGEQAVRAAHPAPLILRTSWVYAPFGHNFLRTMLRLAETRAKIAVVADQIGHPTSALDLADALLALTGEAGLYHLTGAGEASWADLAEVILAASARHGGPTARVRRIASVDYPTPAPRPRQSRLDGSALARRGVVLPDWRESVGRDVAELVCKREVCA